MTEPTGNLKKSLTALGLSIVFGAAVALAAGGSARVHASPKLTATGVHNAADKDAPAALQIFTGKIMSQNGDRYVLRDESSDVWYHLDDQQEAGRFLGKTVQVTGILDGRTATIHVRNIAENKSEDNNDNNK